MCAVRYVALKYKQTILFSEFLYFIVSSNLYFCEILRTFLFRKFQLFEIPRSRKTMDFYGISTSIYMIQGVIYVHFQFLYYWKTYLLISSKDKFLSAGATRTSRAKETKRAWVNGRAQKYKEKSWRAGEAKTRGSAAIQQSVGGDEEG